MELELDKKGIIFNTQKYSIYDGPGVRTIIFIKGCPLKCKWCSNPEGISKNFDIMYVDERCTKCGKCVSFCSKGIHNIKKAHDGIIVHEIDRQIKCDGCKLCQSKCPSEAVRIAGEEKTVKEIINIIEQDSLFYITSGGGVTLSGGEVASQPEFALEILKACKSRGIHTAIETCGQASWEIYKELSKYVDLFLYDLKHIDPDEHKNLVGVNNYKILTNMAKLFSINANIIVRMPMVKGLNDQEWALKGAMKFINKISEGKNLKGIEILPYHKLGVNKYQQLGKEYSIKEDLTYSQSELEKIEDFVKEFDLPVQVVKH